jgi:peptide chain release factor 2
MTVAIDFDAELKQLTATMHTIEQVLDLPAMKSEIAELTEQSSAPDF